MSTFLNRESNKKRMSEREDHCRKAADHFANMSNDYEEAKLKLTEYQYGKSPIQAVLEMHQKIVARRKIAWWMRSETSTAASACTTTSARSLQRPYQLEPCKRNTRTIPTRTTASVARVAASRAP